MRTLSVFEIDEINHTKDFLSSLFILLSGLSEYCAQNGDEDMANALFHLSHTSADFRDKLDEMTKKI